MEEKAQDRGSKYIILTDQYKDHGWFRLYRIQATATFEVSERDGSRTVISPGDFGGWIGGPQNLSQEGNCWVGKNAMVFSDAKVQDNALVTDNALVYGESVIAGNAKISGSANVESVNAGDDARIEDSAWVWYSTLGDSARICHQTRVEHSNLNGHAEVAGESQVRFSQLDDCTVWGTSVVQHSEIGKGCSVQDAKVTWRSTLKHGALVSNGATVSHSVLDGKITVTNHAEVKHFDLIGEKFCITDYAKIEVGSCLILGPFPYISKVLLCKIDCTINDQIVGIIGDEVFLYDDLIEYVVGYAKYKSKDVKKLFDAARKMIWG
ncbi:MAG: hypothetical protein Q4A70_02200 [Candidatus Saccharibacteria bacterium]|nr:hypothetical protein [Candidatus Saccharibacteria bacterium]